MEIMGVPHAYDLTAPRAYPHTLVFIHGWLLSRRYWQPAIDLLASDYQCLAYDLRGFGDSQPEKFAEIIASENSSLLDSKVLRWNPEYTPAAYAQDLELLLEELNISSAWLIGHSLGGSIALWTADRLPHRIKGAICLNAGGGIYIKEAFERFRAAGQQMLKLRPRWLCYLPVIDVFLRYANVAHPLASHWGRQRLLDLAIAQPEAAVRTLLDSTTEAEVNCLPQIVARLQQPVYFIAGAKDTVMEPQYVYHLASFHPLFQACGENVMEISDCGHLAMVEQPEAVADRIRTILECHQD